MWSTIASWVTLLALAAAAANYYNPSLLRSIIPQSRQEHPSSLETAGPVGKRQKSKRTHTSKVDDDGKGASTPTSSNKAVVTKKRKIISAPVVVNATTVQGEKVALPRDEDGELSNRDFAQQLVKAQAGTKLEATSQSMSKKDRRAAKSTQSGHESPGISTETSSNGGRDADDDLSPAGSPPSGPVSTAPTSRTGDVSDMLETPTAKPTTLRLTDVKEVKARSAPKAFEPVMTKKQRQRKAKQEENREMREEADRIQEAKKQAQLRSARMAAGTSNETKANTFNANAWQNGKSDIVKTPRTQAPLLDTFEATTPTNGTVGAKPMTDITNGQTKNSNAVRTEIGSRKTNALAASSRDSRPEFAGKTSWADQVDEEEQNEWASQLVEEEKWESVTNKKTKKAKKDFDTSSEASSTVARPVQPITNGGQLNGVESRPQNINRFSSMERIGGDADWEA